MKNFREDPFLAEISTIQWRFILSQTDDVDILIEEWATLFNIVIEKNAPMREIRVSDKYCQWINSSLKALMKQRDKHKKKSKLNHTKL